MLADGGPFDHFLVGHSVLHGLGAITTIMGLCLAERGWESALTGRSLILLALPTLTVPVNSVAALYCLGVAGILLFWGRLGETQSWLSIVLMFCLFVGAWKIMGSATHRTRRMRHSRRTSLGNGGRLGFG